MIQAHDLHLLWQLDYPKQPTLSTYQNTEEIDFRVAVTMRIRASTVVCINQMVQSQS